jgi:hypothetical protein
MTVPDQPLHGVRSQEPPNLLKKSASDGRCSFNPDLAMNLRAMLSKPHKMTIAISGFKKELILLRPPLFILRQGEQRSVL